MPFPYSSGHQFQRWQVVFESLVTQTVACLRNWKLGQAYCIFEKVPFIKKRWFQSALNIMLTTICHTNLIVKTVVFFSCILNTNLLNRFVSLNHCLTFAIMKKPSLYSNCKSFFLIWENGIAWHYILPDIHSRQIDERSIKLEISKLMGWCNHFFFSFPFPGPHGRCGNQ